MWLQDFRLWAKAELYQSITVYSRMRYYHTENRSARDYTGEEDGIYGPYLDMCYIKADLRPKCDIPFDISVGRQYMKTGRGIVYSNVHDGIQIKGNISPSLVFKTFGSKTKPHDRNLDYSAPGYKKKNKRYFWSTEFAYNGIKNHVFYTYMLHQRDHSWEEPEDGLQDYHYNSQYYGLGASGEPMQSFKYWAEVTKQYGHTYTDARQVPLRKAAVDAWAYNVGGKYRLDMVTHPAFELETAFGSGDKDRQRVTNARRGNLYGNDNNFLYFGTFSAGYAFMPRLSNMFVYKAAVSMQPFERIKFLNLDKIGIGAKYYFYHKHRTNGGIYDVEANQSEKFIGQEMDFYLYWKIRHNLYSSVRYGIFFPGKAYSTEADNKSKYLLASLTLIF